MFKKIAIIVFIIGFILWFRLSGYSDMVTFDNMKSHADFFKDYVNANYFQSALIYFIGYNLFTALALPGAVIISICGGYVFGLTAGFLLSVTAATSGACLAFFASRYLVGAYINRKYKQQLNKFNSELSYNGYLYMLTMRFIPIFPFFLVNILAGLTSMKFRTFLWTTFIGILPGGFAFIYAGSRLSGLNSVKDVMSPEMLSAFVFLGCLALVPVFYKKITGKK